MLVEAMEVKLNKKDALKYIWRKTPLMSRVAQFNIFAKDVHIEYVEFKVLDYEIIGKEKQGKLFRYKNKKKDILMLVNTYSGYSQSIDDIPSTCKKYIDKSYIKKSKMDDMEIIEEVKNQIIYHLTEMNNGEKLIIQDIKIKGIRSIYKPYWVADYKGKIICVDAEKDI